MQCTSSVLTVSLTFAPFRKWWQRLFSRRSPKPLPPPEDIETVQIEEYASSPTVPRKDLPTLSATNPITPPDDSGLDSSESSQDDKDEVETLSTTSSTSNGQKLHNIPVDRKWATRWYWQFLVLTVRTFRQSRHNLLAPLNLVQAVLLAIVCALIWFQVPKVEASISDGYGYVSICVV